MKHKLPILSAIVLGLAIGLASIHLARPMLSATLGASAAASTTGVAAEIEPRQPLVRQAAASLAALESVNVKLRLRVDLFGQQLAGSGRYLQGASLSRKFRYELKLQLGDTFSSVQQVCDGQSLWIRRQIEGPPTVARVDLAKVDAAVDFSRVDASAPRDAGPNAALPMLPLGGRGLAAGGLAGVLLGLDRAFDFRTATEATIGDVPMRAVTGTWRPSRLARMLPDQKAAIEAGGRVDLSKLPVHMPDHVVVYLGRDDKFPYRIDYRRSTDGDPLAAAIDASTATTLVSMELFEARFGSAVDPQEFIYTPGSTPVADETAAYLAELGLTAEKATP
jgi:hypothetical protein